jgi:hypothetical protein
MAIANGTRQSSSILFIRSDLVQRLDDPVDAVEIVITDQVLRDLFASLFFDGNDQVDHCNRVEQLGMNKGLVKAYFFEGYINDLFLYKCFKLFCFHGDSAMDKDSYLPYSLAIR